MAKVKYLQGSAEAAAYVSMAGRKHRCTRSAGSGICEHGRQKKLQGVGGRYVNMAAEREASKECGGNIYVSMAGGRGLTKRVEAAIYVSMQGKLKRQCWGVWRQQSM
jgi:hypothetical protein